MLLVSIQLTSVLLVHWLFEENQHHWSLDTPLQFEVMLAHDVTVTSCLDGATDKHIVIIIHYLRHSLTFNVTAKFSTYEV